MKIKKCVITIAGFGTRLLPITKTISKEMIPIIDLPVIFLSSKRSVFKWNWRNYLRCI